MSDKFSEKTAEYWSNIVEEGEFSSSVYWLANPIVNHYYQVKAVGKREEYGHWVNFCVQHYLANRCPVERMLSIGCGDGDLERHLATLNAFKSIDAVDIAPGRIEIAKAKAREAGVKGISYLVQNVEAVGFPSDTYDAIFYNSSLHHMFEMDKTLRQTAAVLKSDGFLFVNEYIGPNRYKFSQREKEVIQALHKFIPERYRYSLNKRDFGFLQTHAQLPDPLEVARVDPSEAPFSEEIVPTLEKYFEIVEFNKIGGTVLQFLLQNIAGHFREDDPDSLVILDLLIKAEEALINVGDLQSHFALIVARPKQSS